MSSIASCDETLLLELRTASGSIYLCPSRLQRMRLQWTFRHFRILPSQILSRHDQRLIEKLCQSAVVNPSRPVSSGDILGVVENANIPAARPDAAGSGEEAALWGRRLAATAAVAVVLSGFAIAAKTLFHAVPPLPVAQAASQPTRARPSLPILLPIAPPPASLVVAPRHPVAASKPVVVAAVTPAAGAPPAARTEAISANLRWVGELPPGHFARPIVARNSSAGEVQLDVLIAPDGSVLQVTALNGSRQLTDAAVRAIRQWHYSPYGAPGTLVQEEARVRMTFFGSDAVSIGAIAVHP